jgi:cell wall-associated NlpC family hydrolase
LPYVRSIAAACCALALTLTTTGVAQADTSGQIRLKRAEANRVYDQIQQSGRDLERTIATYEMWSTRLHSTNVRVRRNHERLVAARSNLRASRRNLAGSLVAAYKDQQPDVLQAVLASKSLSAMFDEINFIQRANRSNARIVGRIRIYKAEVVRREAALARERRARTIQVRAQAAKRDEITRAVKRQRAMYTSLSRDVRALVDRKRREDAAVAARRAAAARRALAAAAAARVQESAPVVGLGASAGASSAPVSSPSTQEPTYAPPPPSGTGASAVAVAMRYLGVPYVWGGSTPSGFDCSGLTAYAYAAVGISLPHYTGAQWTAGTHVSRDQLAAGDLVFFDGLGHEGMYIGGGQFIHAPHTGDVVRVSSMDEPWYSSNYVGAVRVTG